MVKPKEDTNVRENVQENVQEECPPDGESGRNRSRDPLITRSAQCLATTMISSERPPPPVPNIGATAINFRQMSRVRLGMHDLR